MLILLSAGHSLENRGACYDGVCEWEQASLWVSEIEKAMGFGSLIVPSGSLPYKVNWINQFVGSAALAVEIHFSDSIDQSGCEVVHPAGCDESKFWASVVMTSIGDMFPPSRGVKSCTNGCKEPRHRQIGYDRRTEEQEPIEYFLKRTAIPSVVIEPDSIHNYERIMARKKEACERLAKAFSSASFDKGGAV